MGKNIPLPKVEAKWKERLKALDIYINGLGKDTEKSERNLLRRKIYDACKEADTTPSFYACDSPVGAEKQQQSWLIY